MSDLDEDTGTKLLRILVEQSTANQTVDPPPLEPTSSALAVSTLWFLSIISSLAATTWAMLCLEWCTFLTERRQAEDYEEMAEKRQRRFEAVKRWRMHMVVAFIPFLLHTSLFLFLAGLWLRLRDVNRRLGLIVGIPSLVIVTSYVIVTLLPLFFADAPFSTAATEIIKPLVDKVKRLYRSVHAPPIFPRISSFFSEISSYCRQRLNLPSYERLSHPFWIAVSALITFIKCIYERSGPFVRTITITLVPIFPRFKSGGNPFKELKRLKIGRPNRDTAIQQRALFWLMNTPLTHAQVKEVLKEFRDSGKVADPLDPSIVKLLVLSLSSVLGDGRVSDDERPVFDHCTRILAAEMDRAFGAAEYDPGILLRNPEISERLEPHFREPVEPQPDSQVDEHWLGIITPLWFSPSTEKIERVVQKLESTDVASMEPELLQRAVRALHATMITSLLTSKPPPHTELPPHTEPPPRTKSPLYTEPILNFPLPDLSKWELWEDRSCKPKENGSLKELDKELSAFLQSYFTEFYKSLAPKDRNKPTTVPSLIIECLKLLDDCERWPSLPKKIHSALCFFVVALRRSNLDVIYEGPSVARALAKSTAGYLKDAEMLTVRLLAVAYGPRHLGSRQGTPLENIEAFYRNLPDSVRESTDYIKGFLHANAATLEAVLDDPGHRSARHIVSSSSFTNRTICTFVHDNPHYRLPYLYSLAITLSHGVKGNVPNPPELFGLLMVPGNDPSDDRIDRILDTNVLVVTVLNVILPRQPQSRIAESETKGKPPSQSRLRITESETKGQPPSRSQSRVVESEGKGQPPIKVAQTLGLVQQIVENPESPWKIRWKSIYLLADIVAILPQLGIDPKENELKDAVNNAVAAVKDYVVKQQSGDHCEPLPSDLEVKRGALMEWGALAGRCSEGEGVYDWRKGPQGSVPYLGLYPHARAPHHFLEKFQRQVAPPRQFRNCFDKIL